MRLRLLIVMAATAMLLASAGLIWIGSLEPARAAAASSAGYACPPRLQLRRPGACPAIGLGGEITSLAARGLYPIAPLPTIGPDPNLSYVPWDYLRVGDGSTALYPSPEAALSSGGSGVAVGPGFVFFSSASSIDTGGGRVYATPGGYVRGDNVSDANVSLFQGLAFSRTPPRPFGWIIQGGTCSERTPGEPVDYTGRCFMSHEVVQIYDVQHVGEWDWFLIGPDEWLEQRMIGKVEPTMSPPEGVTGDRWISINLYEQTLTAYAGGRLVFATAASTGRNGNWTQPGLFQIWAKLERDDMTGGIPGENFYYLENVPWVLYFDRARALHGTYWHNRFGAPTSRGCVNLSLADAHWVYEFASEGTWVYVYDPSGNTPTDPALYGEGGA